MTLTINQHGSAVGLRDPAHPPARHCRTGWGDPDLSRRPRGKQSDEVQKLVKLYVRSASHERAKSKLKPLEFHFPRQGGLGWKRDFNASTKRDTRADTPLRVGTNARISAASNS
jgi:hypothetical protein